MLRTLPVLLLLVTACRDADEPAKAPPVAQPAAPPLADASQAALARDIDAAERRGTWYETRQKWQGQVVRWTVTRQRALCASAEACHVAPFPVGHPERHGWMPKLELAAGQYAAIEAACGARPHCELAIEGTLSRLELSGEEPTSVTLSNVRVVQQTARR